MNKNTQLALLAGVGILGYVMYKNTAGTAPATGQQQQTGSQGYGYGQYGSQGQQINYNPNGNYLPSSPNSNGGLIGAAYNYIQGQSGSGGGGYGGYGGGYGSYSYA